MSEMLFYIIALGVCLFGFLTVTSQNIFHCAVWLSLCLLSVAGVYFYLAAEFVGVVQVLVYIGGIITLFVFAIKLTARIDDASIRQTNRQVVPSALFTLGLLAVLVYVIRLTPWAAAQSRPDVTVPDLGRALMTGYVLPFEFISLVLLGVMIGAIVIGKAKR